MHWSFVTTCWFRLSFLLKRLAPYKRTGGCSLAPGPWFDLDVSSIGQ